MSHSSGFSILPRPSQKSRVSPKASVIPAKAGIQRGWVSGELRYFGIGSTTIPSFAMVSSVGQG